MYRLSSIKKHKLLTPASIEFINELSNKVLPSYKFALEKRRNKISNFRQDTKEIRDDDWKITSLPKPLQTRHVEITGPANNKRMVINACNSGADGYMIDLEDSMSPLRKNVLDGHDNIYNLYRRTLKDMKKDKNGYIEKVYKMNKDIPTIFIRHRGIHMKEYLLQDNFKSPISATIFDIGLHLYHNGKYINDNYNNGPYFYTPKLENYEDALFINNIFSTSEELLGLKRGNIKTTVLVETYPAIFQTDEIVYGLKDYISGLNCGRWDYLFSIMKETNLFLPDRKELHMRQPFMEAYVNQIINTCEKRGIYPMGGMSAILPSKDKEENIKNLEKIREDKLLEIERGCRGAWVAHPDLVKPIKELFLNNSSNIERKEVHKNDLENIEYNSDPKIKENINISLQYISEWLNGNGAVSIGGSMEDLATAEISIHQIKQLYRNNILSESQISKDIEDEFTRLKNLNKNTKTIFYEYIFGKYNFLGDVYKENIKEDSFIPIKFSKDIIDKLSGSKGNLSGIDLTRIRGNYLRNYLKKGNTYKFLGTSNGISAVNVVSGGDGVVGPYVGGWQTNAMKNRLGMLLPDTLHVVPEEAATLANEINNHLHQADCVQHLQGKDIINYHNISLLADMEQGWNTPEKIRMSVKMAIKNGINVIHIEDQGDKKRCGHLGDKELNTIEEYCMILRSANLAAQELLGNNQKSVIFVARTDAYSAKRIINSSLLHSTGHPEHKFIDWEKGTSLDGKYLYLKEGINPETGNTYGMDISIQRSVRVIEEGLASHVWMETPDADLKTAQDFMDGVRSNLTDNIAYGLYNHSPSFDWDLKFFKEAEETTNKLLDKVIASDNESIHAIISTFFQKKNIYGDERLTNKDLDKIIIHCSDYKNGLKYWEKEKKFIKNIYLPMTSIKDDIHKYISEIEYKPKENITEIIVNHRLKEFSNQLTSFGYNLHLITLPEFHVTAFHMHQLSRNFSKEGINAFVKSIQRPERILSENDDTYTYYKHQTATGTGLEAYFNKAVGSSNINVLDGSTEQDDLKQRK